MKNRSSLKNFSAKLRFPNYNYRILKSNLTNHLSFSHYFVVISPWILEVYILVFKHFFSILQSYESPKYIILDPPFIDSFFGIKIFHEFLGTKKGFFFKAMHLTQEICNRSGANIKNKKETTQ